ncbi:MAG TPA: hypothetical protein VNU64_14960 [Burkholderiales bacterium]|nr:hypothetical protein [Burkholderiales bacterium]
MLRALAVPLVALLVASCGGGSGSVSPAPPASGSRIFVGDTTNAAIASSSNLNPSPGVLAVERTIAGANTQLDTNLFDFALDATNDRLYVADLRSVLVFNNASTLSGNATPSRTVTTLPGPFGGFSGGIFLDTTRNMLYAATNFIGTTQNVQVFDNASTASGATATRTITFTIRSISDIVVDTTRNILYVYGTDAAGFAEVLSFDNASTLTGAVVPNRTINFPDSGGTGPIGLFVDAASDRLYVPRNDGTIAVFNTASTVTGNVTVNALPSRTINLPQPGYTALLVDVSANRLYAVDPAGISIIANASTVSGTPTTITRVLASNGATFQAIAVKP